VVFVGFRGFVICAVCRVLFCFGGLWWFGVVLVMFACLWTLHFLVGIIHILEGFAGAYATRWVVGLW